MRHCIGVARGCTCTPRVDKKNVGPNLQGKVVSAALIQRVHLPKAEQESHFLKETGEIWAVGEVI